MLKMFPRSKKVSLHHVTFNIGIQHLDYETNVDHEEKTVKLWTFFAIVEVRSKYLRSDVIPEITVLTKTDWKIPMNYVQDCQQADLDVCTNLFDVAFSQYNDAHCKKIEEEKLEQIDDKSKSLLETEKVESGFEEDDNEYDDHTMIDLCSDTKSIYDSDVKVLLELGQELPVLEGVKIEHFGHTLHLQVLLEMYKCRVKPKLKNLSVVVIVAAKTILLYNWGFYINALLQKDETINPLDRLK
ncbi:hypothetical protein FF38_05175 [Lucilia cuprina]|uniref:Uncharacterized protein n=1 Tax=Lucilia cuprina TaxID=7375 RepID=A0A0L0BZR7_LUCCU|nr:hypothetical protein FF38_05175 [Lucilia cuprina]